MKDQTGYIAVICGSMFCGKTEELIRRLKRAVIARQKVQVFKPAIDNRFDEVKVISHGGMAFDAIPVLDSHEIWIKWRLIQPSSASMKPSLWMTAL